MEEVKFKMGKYSDLIKLFEEGQIDNGTIYFANSEKNIKDNDNNRT